MIAVAVQTYIPCLCRAIDASCCVSTHTGISNNPLIKGMFSECLFPVQSDCEALVTEFNTRFASALVSGDVEEVNDLFHPDVEHVMVGDSIRMGKQGK